MLNATKDLSIRLRLENEVSVAAVQVQNQLKRLGDEAKATKENWKDLSEAASGVNAALEIVGKAAQFVGDAYQLAIDSTREYAKINEEAARSIELHDQAITHLQASLGKLVQSSGSVDAITKGIEGWASTLEFWSTLDVAKIGAVVDEMERANEAAIEAARIKRLEGLETTLRQNEEEDLRRWKEREDKKEKDAIERAQKLAREEAKAAAEERARVASEARNEFALPGEQSTLENAYLEGIRKQNEAEEDLIAQAEAREEAHAQYLKDVLELESRMREEAADREIRAAEKAAAAVAKASEKKNKATEKSEKDQQQLLSATFGLLEQGATIAAAAAISYGGAAKSRAAAEREAAGMVAAVQAGLEFARALQEGAAQNYGAAAQHAAAAIAFAAVAKSSFTATSGDRAGEAREAHGIRGGGDDGGSMTRARRDRQDEGGGTSTTIIYHVQGNIMGDRAAARYQEQLRRVGRRSGLVPGGRG